MLLLIIFFQLILIPTRKFSLRAFGVKMTTMYALFIRMVVWIKIMMTITMYSFPTDKIASPDRSNSNVGVFCVRERGDLNSYTNIDVNYSYDTDKNKYFLPRWTGKKYSANKENHFQWLYIKFNYYHFLNIRHIL